MMERMTIPTTVNAAISGLKIIEVTVIIVLMVEKNVFLSVLSLTATPLCVLIGTFSLLI
jgi:hypothetical protein